MKNISYIKGSKSSIIKWSIIFLVSSLLLAFIMTINLDKLPSSFIQAVNDTLNDMAQNFSDGKYEYIQDKRPSSFNSLDISATKIIINNISVGFRALTLGFLPFIYLPIIIYIINIGILSTVIALIAQGSVFAAVKVFTLGILPHGIIEIPALIISIMLGVRICSNISRTIIGKVDYSNTGKVIKESIISFLLIVVPMFILAGVIEVYITPLLLIQGY